MSRHHSGADGSGIIRRATRPHVVTVNVWVMATHENGSVRDELITFKHKSIEVEQATLTTPNVKKMAPDWLPGGWHKDPTEDVLMEEHPTRGYIENVYIPAIRTMFGLPSSAFGAT